MEQKELTDIVMRVVQKISGQDASFPVEMSARHVHLTQEAVEILFGKGALLKIKRELSLPGFLAEQRVSLITSKGAFRNVAILGPVRDHIQVELAASDAYALGLKPPVNISGNLNGAADVYIAGPHGMLPANSSAIIAQAHVHMNAAEARAMGVENQEIVAVDILSKRPITIKNVMIRVENGMHATMHIDMDEANACGYGGEMRGVISKIAKE